ncbi:MAG: DUF4199 domain-containing protein [Saprospiraceae bacterium]|nr:DUF4199 domain-containing protein [Saprospiraceae bacterium]
MRQTVLRYGLISGAVSAVLMTATAMYFRSHSDTGYGAILGYIGIFLSMMFIFAGVRHYREQSGGSLGFGQGLKVGLLIALISCVCYVLAWMVVYATLMPDFMDTYIQAAMENLRNSGASEAEIQAQAAEMAHYKEMYQNPMYRFALTFLEPFPVAFLVSLISAVVLRRK